MLPLYGGQAALLSAPTAVLEGTDVLSLRGANSLLLQSAGPVSLGSTTDAFTAVAPTVASVYGGTSAFLRGVAAATVFSHALLRLLSDGVALLQSAGGLSLLSGDVLRASGSVATLISSGGDVTVASPATLQLAATWCCPRRPHLAACVRSGTST